MYVSTQSMGMSYLPDVYTRNLRAAGPMLRVHISGEPQVHMV